MRQIKFRGKDITTGEWRYGSLVNNLWNYSKHHSLHGLDVCDIISSGECDDYESMQESELNRTVDPRTVGQFTGLMDKNDKEIYEGDLLYPFNESIGPYKVVFENGSFICYHKHGRWGLLSRIFDADIRKSYSVSVIGNIYEEPTLITNTLKG